MTKEEITQRIEDYTERAQQHLAQWQRSLGAIDVLEDLLNNIDADSAGDVTAPKNQDPAPASTGKGKK